MPIAYACVLLAGLRFSSPTVMTLQPKPNKVSLRLLLRSQEWGGEFLVDVDGSKVLSCGFRSNVLCSYRKFEGFGLMERCFTCREYRRFMREMAEEDEKEADEVEELNRLRARYESGEFDEEEFRKRFFAYRHRDSE